MKVAVKNPVKRGVAFLCLLALASPSQGQDMSDRARTLLGQMDPVTEMLTDQTMQRTLIPFETAAPPEARLAPEAFEEEALRRRTNGSVEGGAYGAQADSAFTRPDVDLGADPLSLADDAVQTAPQTVGGFFSEAGGSCTSSFTGGEYSGAQFCTRILARSINTCQEWREITVDRQDTWQCAVEGATYRQQCDRRPRYTCTGARGGACIRQTVLISGANATWNATGTRAVLALPAVARTSCGISSHTVTLTLPPTVQLTSLNTVLGSYNGVLQVQVNGDVVATTRNGVLETGLPTDAYLGIADRDCGKRCTIPAVYAGGTWIEDCADARHTSTLDIPLAPLQAGRDLTLETPTLPGVVALIGTSATIELRILTANTLETGSAITLTFAGSCCSEVSASLGDAC